MNSISQNKAGIASGVNNAIARTAGLIAIAVLGVVMLQVFKTSLHHRLTNLPATAAQSVLSQSARLAAIAIPDDLDPETRELVRQEIRESFVSGFRFVMGIGAALAAASALTAFITISNRARSNLADAR
jgi:TRAP-type uncharacterized transport system fused permease subunit